MQLDWVKSQLEEKSQKLLTGAAFKEEAPSDEVIADIRDTFEKGLRAVIERHNANSAKLKKL